MSLFTGTIETLELSRLPPVDICAEIYIHHARNSEGQFDTSDIYFPVPLSAGASSLQAKKIGEHLFEG